MRKSAELLAVLSFLAAACAGPRAASAPRTPLERLDAGLTPPPTGYAPGAFERETLERLLALEKEASSAPEPAPPPGQGELLVLIFEGPALSKSTGSWTAAWDESLAAFHRAVEHGDPVGDDPEVKKALAEGVVVASMTVAWAAYEAPATLAPRLELTAGGLSGAASLSADLASAAAKEKPVGEERDRLLARALAQNLKSRRLDAALARKYGKDSWQRYLAIETTDITRVDADQADARGWKGLPSRIHTARLLLPPGRHEAAVALTGADGHVLRTAGLGTVTVPDRGRAWKTLRILP